MNLKTLATAVEQRGGPVDLFFRDDDAGWAMDELDAMLDIFAEHRCTVDLATIPAAIDRAASARLVRWREQWHGVGFHQHGYAHVNHQPDGERKCEFGWARSVADQRSDISLGQRILSDLLGTVDPIFTPPWNRLVPETVKCTAELGFSILSCDVSAGRGGGSGEPRALPISVDWDKERRRDADSGVSSAIADACRGDLQPVGIMLHHATLDGDARDELAELIQFLSGIREVRIHPMRHWR